MVPVCVLVFSPSRCGMRLGLSRAVSSRVPGVRRPGLVSCRSFFLERQELLADAMHAVRNEVLGVEPLEIARRLLVQAQKSWPQRQLQAVPNPTRRFQRPSVCFRLDHLRRGRAVTRRGCVVLADNDYFGAMVSRSSTDGTWPTAAVICLVVALLVEQAAPISLSPFRLFITLTTFVGWCVATLSPRHLPSRLRRNSLS